MNRKHPVLKEIGYSSLIVIIALIMAACSSLKADLQGNNGQIAICHAASDTANPYEQISVDFNELVTHGDHPNDLIPAPAEGCPKTIVPDANDGKLTICHATGSTTNPYNEITIDFNGLNGHGKHTDDLIPAPESGCPSSRETPMTTMTATITQTPTVTITPEGTLESSDKKITICHATGSAKNPYVMITISVNGLNGHDKHPRDIIPAPAGGCPNKK
jgi:hypothetical protein